MILRSIATWTTGHVVDNALLIRDLNQDPDRYRANSIHVSNNNNSIDDVDDLTNLGDSIFMSNF